MVKNKLGSAILIPFILIIFSGITPRDGFAGPPPIGAKVWGYIHADGILLTSGNSLGYRIVITKETGAAYQPAAEDESIDPGYLISIPIFESESQPGGANPGDKAIVHVFKDGAALIVTSPENGEFIVGESSSIAQMDVAAVNNHPPEADTGPDQNVYEGDGVTLNGSNSFDPDSWDEIVSYEWKQTSGPVVELADPSAATTTFTAPNPGEEGVALTFELSVTDTKGAVGADECKVTVLIAVLPGDVNNDGGVDLTDAILVLKTVSATSFPEKIFKGADINDDGKIGIEEGIFVLRGIN